jgi:hypothetical protein
MSGEAGFGHAQDNADRSKRSQRLRSVHDYALVAIGRPAHVEEGHLSGSHPATRLIPAQGGKGLGRQDGPEFRWLRNPIDDQASVEGHSK